MSPPAITTDTVTIEKRPSRIRWATAALVCVALQAGLTVTATSEYSFLDAGMAALSGLCAALTFVMTPRAACGVQIWRWHIVTFGFAIWSLGWAAGTLLSPYATDMPFLGLVALVRQVIFLVVLLPTTKEDQGWQFRALDIAQVALLFAILTILSLPGKVLGIEQAPKVYYYYIGHVVLALVAIASYLKQQDDTRRLTGPLLIVLTVYAATSVMAAFIDTNWNVPPASLIWLLGDTAFLLYIVVLLIQPAWLLRDKGCPRQARSNFPPLLLTSGVLILSIELGRRSLPWGMGAGTIGLIIYAARTTMLSERYLSARDHLIEIEEARGRALVDIVHEIRSPLGSVTLNAWLLAQGDAVPHPQRRWVEQIHASTTRVTALLNDVLDLERLDAGLVELDIRPCDTQTVVTDALAVVAPQAKEYGIALAPPTGTALPHVIADPANLGRVLVNLATNAVRFTPRGGRVAVAIRYLDAHRVAITVEDTGIGIPAAAQQYLFERFGHIETPVNGLRGSGLGLSICRGLITAMRGELRIDSTPQVGTTATIILPAGDEYSPAAPI